MTSALLASVPHVTAVIFVFVCPCALSWAGPVREGNPSLGNRMYLVTQTHRCLVILPDGRVLGSNDTDRYGLLEVTAVDFGQEVRLRGVEAGLFLAMDAAGRLYGEGDGRHPATLFVAGVHGAYNTYQAKAHEGEAAWFVGLRRRTGLPKPGPQTRRDHKAAKFLPVRPAAS